VDALNFCLAVLFPNSLARVPSHPTIRAENRALGVGRASLEKRKAACPKEKNLKPGDRAEKLLCQTKISQRPGKD